MSVSLHNLVALNNYDGTKKFIDKAKKQKGCYWMGSDYVVNDACRDAILLGHKKIVQLFLDEGLNPRSKAHTKSNNWEVLPLKYFAAKVGNLSAVKQLMDKDDGRFFEKDYDQMMRVAIQGGHVDVIQYLLEHGGSAEGFFEEFPYRQNFLGRAAFDGQKRMVDLLIKHGADIEDALRSNDRKFRVCGQIEKCDIQQYAQSVQMLLDGAIGIDFSDELTFLEGLDISEFNFLGVSIDAQPITRRMLISQGLKGADKALVTRQDIAEIEDKERRTTLLARLETLMKSHGEIISQDGVVNLVSLIDAAKKGHLDVIRVRLSAGIDPNQVAYSYSAIVAAARKGFVKVVKILAKHPKIDPKLCVEAAWTAKQESHIEIFEYLTSVINVNEKDHQENALIHYAVRRADIELIKYLLSKGAEINLANGEGDTPLFLSVALSLNHWYSKQDRIELLKCLLENGADPNQYSQWSDSPLYAAVQIGNLEAMKLLLPVTEKRDFEVEDGYGENVKKRIVPWYVPLMFDSYGTEKWLQILSLLKEHGADFNAMNDRGAKDTLLHRVTNSFPSSQNMRRLGFEIESAMLRGEIRSRPLKEYFHELNEKAINKFKENFEHLRFLLENGADPNLARDITQEAPLHDFIAIHIDYFERAVEQVIELFLKYKMDINASDAYGVTLLHEAVRVKNLPAVTCLISKNANINAKTKCGCTPLHLAAEGSPEITQLLIAAGADVNAIDEKGETPLTYSRQVYIDNERYMCFPEEQAVLYSKAQTLLKAAGENGQSYELLKSDQSHEWSCILI